MFIHTFQFRLKPEVSDNQVGDAIDGILALQKQIPGILQAYVGRNVSERGKGFGMGGVMHFDDQAAFEAYTEHPAHQTLVQSLLPLLEEAVEVDFYPDPAAGGRGGGDLAL